VCRSIDECVLCWLATCSASGAPNVSPKEVFAAFNGDSLVIANIASPNSARNIRATGRACVAFVDVFTQRGFQVSGAARELRKDDPSFESIESILLVLTEGKFPFKSVFRVMAEEVRTILAPRYVLYPETTEEEQIASAMVRYGVRPAT
ncbi:MAG: pyridoxamine 5'-phosphate oxidase family protein, partial [Phycisphaerales bacterium]|nr:pyridoxamine 5'-phosphate oxidase family protein [Phycisphaerales bacterium]